MNPNHHVEIFFEVCTHCELHQWCTHHQPNKYLNHFNKIKNQILEFDPFTSIKLNMPPKSYVKVAGIKPTFLDLDDNKLKNFPRIGAFEVKISEKIVCSKLETGVWPSSEKIINFIRSLAQNTEEKNYYDEKSQSKFLTSKNSNNKTKNINNNVGFIAKKINIRTLSPPQTSPKPPPQKNYSKSPISQIQEKIFKKFGKELSIIKEISDPFNKEFKNMIIPKTEQNNQRKSRKFPPFDKYKKINEYNNTNFKNMMKLKLPPSKSPKNRNFLEKREEQQQNNVKIVKAPQNFKWQFKMPEQKKIESEESFNTIPIVSLEHLEKEYKRYNSQNKRESSFKQNKPEKVNSRYMKSILIEGTDQEISQNDEITTYQKLEIFEAKQNFMKSEQGSSDFLLKFSNNSFRYQKQEKHKLDGSMEENIYR